ncbi:MAG TPA: ELWxxDGT repeat protein, partial [Planctomycetota bacterium]|nr:ELWxxDGT repeat protein [Planctomycetota bacterium]
AFGSLLLFSADNGVNGREPWITDGTPAGTSMLAELAAGSASSTPLHFASAGSTFYCDAALGASGRTLCIGTAGIVAPVRNFARVDAIGVFGTSALCCADDGATGPEPWISDGTPAGTTLLLDIQFTARGSGPAGFHAIGDDFVYSTDDGVVGRELWRVPAGGTPTLLADILPGPGSSAPGYVVEYRGWHWFAAYDPVNGNELWRTDGTAAGTQLFANLTSGWPSTNPLWLTVAADRLFFTSGYTLWASDGTVAGTTPLRTFFQRFPFPSPPALFAEVAGKLLFAADDASVGVELWESDGTAAGTVLLRDIHPGAASSSPDRFAVAGDRMFFRANSPLGFELWISDGTSAGTTGLDLRPGPGSSYPDRITPAGPVVFLTLLDNASAVRPWRSDGTVAGTVQLSAVAFDPRSLTVAGDKLFFSATDNAGREPWVSDGTPAGTFRLRDVWPGSASSMSEPAGFGAAGSGARVVFGANDSVHGVDLWTSDGTPNGTTLLADIAPEILDSNPSGFVRIGTDLFFVADDYAHGPELWRLPLAQLQVPLVETIAPGCPPVGGAVPRLSAVGLPVLGNPSFGLRLEDAPPFAIVLTAFDVVAQPIPVAGCTLAFANPFLLLVGISDGSGVQTTSFSIPFASSLLGLILLEQDVVFDANGPAGLFTMSNALRTMIGR